MSTNPLTTNVDGKSSLCVSDVAQLRNVLHSLTHYASLHAMDRVLFDESGNFDGLEKTSEFEALLKQAWLILEERSDEA